MNRQVAGSLSRNAVRPLIRVVESPGAASVREYTGADLLAATALLDDLELGTESRVVLILLPHSPELFLLQVGLVLNGKIPAVLPWPTTRVDGEKYQRNLLHQLCNLPADHLITLPSLAKNLRPLLGFPVTGFAVTNHAYFDAMFIACPAIMGGERQAYRRAPPAPLPADALFLQFSGGTTGTQKCVVVTEAMLAQQVASLSAALGPGEGDCVVSWLPLYHDMGLIACLYFPLLTGMPSVHLAAGDWLMRPELLFRFVETYKGSYCWMPNFAFSYLAQRKDMMEGTYSLGHVRAWISCSEPVRRTSFSEFVGRFGEWGVSPDCLHSSYAMAENVFAVTQSVGSVPASVARSRVGGSSLSYLPNAFEVLDDVYVSSGRCLPGMNARIVAPDGSICPDLFSGEIQLKTSCMFNGYWDGSGFSREPFTVEGWYRSGDFGFFESGELFVIGRMKDIIIVAGQNVFPEDIEMITSQVAGVQPGRIVAFGVDNEELGTQSIAVVAEMSGEFDRVRAADIEREVRRLISACLGIAARHVRIVPQRWVVKSTAGKISRRDTRNRFLHGERAENTEVPDAAGS